MASRSNIHIETVQMMAIYINLNFKNYINFPKVFAVIEFPFCYKFYNHWKSRNLENKFFLFVNKYHKPVIWP